MGHLVHILKYVPDLIEPPVVVLLELALDLVGQLPEEVHIGRIPAGSHMMFAAGG